MAIFFLSIIFLIGFSFTKPHDQKSRTSDKDLSDFVHYEDDIHNVKYDQDAFLGGNEARKTASITPEESRKLLGNLVDKIDSDHDGYVGFDEMKAHLNLNSRRYVKENVDRTFNEYKAEFNIDYITFENHKSKLTDDFEDEDDEDGKEPDLIKAIKRDEIRFNKADANGDGKLSKEEFSDFLHPEESKHMREIVIDETIEDLDTDHDGRISIDEYTNDMWNKDENPTMPEWVETERKQFRDVRDKDHDGYLDRDEIRDWLFPEDFNHIDSEAKHLITEADDNGDGKLTKSEILAHYDIFMSSQATDFGQALRPHEEL